MIKINHLNSLTMKFPIEKMFFDQFSYGVVHYPKSGLNNPNLVELYYKGSHFKGKQKHMEKKKTSHIFKLSKTKGYKKWLLKKATKL